MDVILQTKRLLLSEMSASDAQYFFELNNDPLVVKYTADLPFENINAASDFLKNYSKNNYEKYGYGRWSVILKETNEWLGWCGLKYSQDNVETDIGYRFYRKYWGNGYATESAKACLEYGFEKLQLKRIIGRAMKENVASIIVLEKIGMRFEKEFLMDGIYPSVQYSLYK